MKLSEIQGASTPPRSGGMKLSSVMRPKEPEYRVTDDMSGYERVMAGIGGGVTKFGRTAANLVGLDALMPEFASDEAIKEQDEIDKDLDSTTGGMAGKIIGQTVASAPLGFAAGRGLNAVMAARKGLQGAEAAKYIAGYGPGRAALEGAVEGGLLANPDERLQGAGFGAASGGILSGAAKGLGWAGKKLTPTQSAASRELQRLERDAGVDAAETFIPISQSADDGIWKQFYEGIVANLPGSGQKLRGQLDNAVQSFRQLGAHEATPVFARGGDLHTPGLDVVMRHGDDAQSALRNLNNLDGLWDDAFEPARKVAGIRVPKNWGIPKKLQEALDAHGVTAPSGVVTGRELLDFKQQANEAIRKTSTVWGRKDKVEIADFIKNQIDNRIIGGLKRMGKLKNQEPLLYKAYVENLRRYTKYLQFQGAVKAGGGSGEYSAKQFLNAATKHHKRGIFGQGGQQQTIGKLGAGVLDPFPSKQGIFQTAAALGVMGGGAGLGAAVSDDNLTGGAIGLGSVLLGGRMLSRPGVQNALLGNYSPRAKLMAEGLRRAGRLGRAATIPAYLENDQ